MNDTEIITGLTSFQEEEEKYSKSKHNFLDTARSDFKEKVGASCPINFKLRSPQKDFLI